MRQFLGRELGYLDAADKAAAGGKAHSLLWVTDFPMFEFDPEEQR